MKTLSKINLFTFFLFLIISLPLSAQPVAKAKAEKAISRTAFIIKAAHKATSENKIYTGNLKESIVQQKIAIDFYAQGKYMRSIHHTIRSREFARLQLEANSGDLPSNYAPSNDAPPEGPLPAIEILDEVAKSSAYFKSTPDDKSISSKPLNKIDLSE